MNPLLPPYPHDCALVIVGDELRCRPDPPYTVHVALAFALLAGLVALVLWARGRRPGRARRSTLRLPVEDSPGLYAADDRVVDVGPARATDAPTGAPAAGGGFRDQPPPAVVRRGEVLGSLGLVRGEVIAKVRWDDGTVEDVPEGRLVHEFLHVAVHLPR